MSLLRRLRTLAANRSGVAMIEFALGAPVLLTAGLWGVEIANLAVTNMRINQLAIHIADNGSRIGDTATLADRKIYEADLNDLLIGANIQGGAGLDLYQHGRVIISSLEVESSSNRQFIHWQRCRGTKHVGSSYGNEGDGLSGGVSGIGPSSQQVAAEPDDAVIFVEIKYDYQPLISHRFLGADNTISTIAAFTVRDDRDLSQIYQRDPASPDEVSGCAAYTGAPVASS
jgi:hypothetical protein